MTTEEHRAKLRRIAKERERIEKAEPAAILAALAAGVPQKEVAADLGRTREHVRRVVIRAKETDRA